MRENTFFVVFMILIVFFGVIKDVEGYEVYTCVCYEGAFSVCNCDANEEAADQSGEMGCGLAYPVKDMWGALDYCEISNKDDAPHPRGVSVDPINWGLVGFLDPHWGGIRHTVCTGACHDSCTGDPDCSECDLMHIECHPDYSCRADCDILGQNCNPQGHKVVARLDKCPSTADYLARFPITAGDPLTAPDGYQCNIGLDPAFDPWPDTAEWFLGGKWDASQDKCISCMGNLEDKIYGTSGGVYVDVGDDAIFAPTEDMYHGTCETACRAPGLMVDDACDEVLNGGLCTAGDLCQNIVDINGNTVTCDGTQTCINCRCMPSAVCPDGIVTPPEQCDPLSGLPRNGCPLGFTCQADCTCMSLMCGNGHIDAPVEECDPPDMGACTGSCVLPGNIDECKCQVCGDGTTTGFGNLAGEECDPGPPPETSHCAAGETCNEVCKCIGGPATGGSCEFIAVTEIILFGEEKEVAGGVVKYAEKPLSNENHCPNLAKLDITFPTDVGGSVSGESFWNPPKEKSWASGAAEYHVSVEQILDCPPLQGPPLCGDECKIEVKAWCTALPGGEICNNQVDEPDKVNNATLCDPALCGMACDPNCEVGSFDLLIDCEDVDECPPPPPGFCGDCGTDTCCDVGGEEGCPAIANYQWSCKKKPGVQCASPLDCGNPGDWICEVPACTCSMLREIPSVCNNFDPVTGLPMDDDGDGCANAEDSDCGGTEDKYGDAGCLDAADNDCDGLIDCNDFSDCSQTDPGCNVCQDRGCDPMGGVGTGGWSCTTSAFADCSTNEECTTDPKIWCNLNTCQCEVPPDAVIIQEKLDFIGCRIIVILQGIAAGIATLILVYAGIKWMGSGVENPAARTEAAEMIKKVFIGLVIIIIALQLVNMLFGAELGSIKC